MGGNEFSVNSGMSSDQTKPKRNDAVIRLFRHMLITAICFWAFHKWRWGGLESKGTRRENNFFQMVFRHFRLGLEVSCYKLLSIHQDNLVVVIPTQTVSPSTSLFIYRTDTDGFGFSCIGG